MRTLKESAIPHNLIKPHDYAVLRVNHFRVDVYQIGLPAASVRGPVGATPQRQESEPIAC